MANNFISLNDEVGNEVQFEFLDLVEYDGNEYVVLLPVDDDNEEGQVVILQIEESGIETDTESYISVESEEILMEVFAIFRERNKNKFDFGV